MVDHETMLANLKALKEKKGLRSKQIAAIANIPERSVSRVFSGETDDPGIFIVSKILYALGGTWADIAGESGGKNLAELLASEEKLTAELDHLQKESNALQQSNKSMELELNLLRQEVKHKDELLAVHNSYIQLGLAQSKSMQAKPRKTKNDQSNK